MSDFKDKGDTFRFRPGEEEKKPQINRSEYDEYSSARRSKVYEEEEEKSSNILPYIAIALAVLLIIAVVAGIFILKQGKGPQNNIPEDETVIKIPEDEEEEEEEEPEITLVCSIVFDSSRIYKTDDGYAVLADLYDKDFYSFDSRKLIINEETDIRESGKRISKDALIYLIRNTAGDAIVFDGEIRESDNTILSISFDSSVLEEPEEEAPEEENPPKEPEKTPEEGEGNIEGTVDNIENKTEEE